MVAERNPWQFYERMPRSWSCAIPGSRIPKQPTETKHYFQFSCKTSNICNIVIIM